MLSFKEFIVLEDRIPFIKAHFKTPIEKAISNDKSSAIKTSDELIDRFSKIDPTEKNHYTQWLSNQYAKGNISHEKMDSVKSAIEFFHSNKEKLIDKNINSYDISDLIELKNNFTNKKSDKERGFPVNKNIEYADSIEKLKKGTYSIKDVENVSVLDKNAIIQGLHTRLDNKTVTNKHIDHAIENNYFIPGHKTKTSKLVDETLKKDKPNYGIINSFANGGFLSPKQINILKKTFDQELVKGKIHKDVFPILANNGLLDDKHIKTLSKRLDTLIPKNPKNISDEVANAKIGGYLKPNHIQSLMGHKNENVRNEIASANITDNTLQNFIYDESPRVRTSVASNKNSNQVTLDKMKYDKDPNVRKAVGLNLNTHLSTLNVMLDTEKNADLKKVFKETIKQREDMLNQILKKK